MEDNKLPPYQRLKAVLKGDDVIMTDKSLKNLNELLGDNKTKEVSIFSKFITFLKSIDRKIFMKQSRMYSNKYHRRK